MTTVDYAAVGIAGLSVLVSLFRGAVREVMALCLLDRRVLDRALLRPHVLQACCRHRSAIPGSAWLSPSPV